VADIDRTPRGIDMRLFERMALLVRADAHGVLDQLEERALLARQHLREAELEVDRKRARAEALGEEARRVGEQAQKLAAEVTALDQDVELALRGDKDELAHFAVRRLLPKRRALETLRVREGELGDAQTRLAERLEEQERSLEDLRLRVKTHLAAARSEAAFEVPDPLTEVPDEEVELELLRRREAR
jgi:phage shock protein A